MDTGGPILMNMSRQPMNKNTDVLTLTQLLSPSFPVGTFAYSHGLETAVSDGIVNSADDLQNWLLDLLQHGGARSDAVLLNMAYARDCEVVDAQARAFASSSERLKETDLQGAAFCDTVRAIWGFDVRQLTYPVAVGRTACLLAFDVELTTALYVQSSVGNLIAAAMRMSVVGQTEGQLIHADLKPHFAIIAQEACGASIDDLNSNAWMADIMSMRHETQYSRVFRS